MMKRWMLAASIALWFLPVFAHGDKTTEFVFPAVKPGMKLEQLRKIVPGIKARSETMKGQEGYSAPDTERYTDLRFLFVRGKLAMFSYLLREKNLKPAILRAREAYPGDFEGDGVSSYRRITKSGVLQISGESDDGSGSVSFIDSKAMKSLNPTD